MHRLASTTVAIMLLLTACSQNTQSGLAFDGARQRSETIDGVYPWTTMESLVEWVADDTKSLGQLSMITGDITSVEPGRSFSWDAIGTTRIEHEFADPEAWVDTFHLSVDVDSNLAGKAVPTSVTVGIALNSGVGLDAVRKDFGELDNVVIFLRQSPVFDYEPNIWGIVEDGSLLGQIDDAGLVTFPLVTHPGHEVPAEGIKLAALINIAEETKPE